jgi:hypothetical protein
MPGLCPASLVGMDRAPDSDMGPQFERRTQIFSDYAELH